MDKPNLDMTPPAQGQSTPTFRFKYPFNDMSEVHDSFFVEFTGDDQRDAKIKTSVRAAAHQYGHRHGMKFITRVVVENGKRGLRVWRLL